MAELADAQRSGRCSGNKETAIIPTLWQNHALGHISGMTVAFMDAFEPLASMIGSIIVFHFQPQMMDYAASVMIIFAVLALNWTPRSKIKSQVEK
ncbi:hypothetical protein ACIA3Z_09285 [Lactobacillus delbrueckii subsp. bulgaricus]